MMKDRPSQVELEAMYSQKNIHTVLHTGIEYEFDKFLLSWALRAYIHIPDLINGDYYESKNIRMDTLAKYIAEHGLDTIVVALAAAVLHTHTVQTLQQCVGYLAGYMPHTDTFDRARTAAELIAVCSREKGLYSIKRNGSGRPTTIEILHWPFIDKAFMDSFDWINDTCFNLPMIEPPDEVTSNRRCGYHSLKEPLLLGRLTMHDEKQNYDTINTLNKIQWVLDDGVLTEAEVPAKPLETPEQHKLFLKMVNDSNFVYDILGDDPFWLCWQYDSRGRIYSHGYHVNLQAAEYKKASLNFNQYQYLT